MGAVALLRLTALALAALPGAALAHHAGTQEAWHPEAWVVALVAAAGLLYAAGVRTLWRRAGVGRGIRRAQAVRFALGWLALAAALASPIDAAGAASFAAHMVQHELLMVVAAPLLVLGRPLEAWAWALPPGALRALAAVAHSRALRSLWSRLTEPVGAWCVHAVALWIWHLPLLFEAALAHEAIHVAQHVSFFGSALAFWWAVFGRGVHAPDAASLASLFTTMLHTAALGALLTFAPHAWYSAYAAGAYGFSALEDQQLGGLVMWVPAGLAYIAAGLFIVGQWLRPQKA